MSKQRSIEENMENVMRFLFERFPNARDLIKPTIFHSIRVGTYLYEKGYAEDISIAGLLHDILEDTDVTEVEIQDLYGENVLAIVKANTKDMKITNKEERNKDLIMRCIASEKALIVKCADIMDNYRYRVRRKNIPEIERCTMLTKMIRENIPESYKDKIFWKLFSLIV